MISVDSGPDARIKIDFKGARFPFSLICFPRIVRVCG